MWDWRKFLTKKKTRGSKVDKVLVQGGYGGARWSDKNYANYAEESYLKNVIAFRCIKEIAENVASVPWGVFTINSKGKRDKEVNDHPILDVLRRPNPKEGWPFLIAKATAFLLMAGNSYIERISPETGPYKGIPKELYTQRPDRVRIEINESTGWIKRYVYSAGGREVYWNVDPITRQSNLLHLLAFNPTDDWYGAAITESVAREIDTSNEQTEWNKKLLELQGRPGLVVTIVGNLDDEAYERMEKSLNEKFGGAGKAGKSLIIEGEKGTKAEPYGWSPTDMDFLEGGRELARRISLGYGVPPQLLGIPGDSTFSNYEQARLAFYEDTVFYVLNYMLSEFSNWAFRPKEKLMFDMIIDDIPALAPRRERMWKRAQESGFLTINEKRQLVRKDPIPGGDIILVPNHMVPLNMLETIIENNGNNNNNEDDDDDDNKLISSSKKLILKGGRDV